MAQSSAHVKIDRRVRGLAALGCIACWSFGLSSVAVAGGPLTTQQLYDRVIQHAESRSWNTIQTDYVIESTSIVDGVAFSFENYGRLWIKRRADHRLDLVNHEYLTPITGVPDRIDVFEGDRARSYHPYTQYAQLLPASSLSKDKTRLGKFWLPLLAFLDPEGIIESVQHLDFRTVSHQGGSMNALYHDFDQRVELDQLTAGAKLEYWGPPGDPYHVADNRNRVIGRSVEYVRFPTDGTGQSQEPIITKTTKAYLGGITLQPGGLEFPTTIDYSVKLPRYLTPHFTARVTFSNTQVDQPWPADLLAQIPDEAIFLCAEKPRPEDIPEADPLAETIMTADYYFGVGNTAAGANVLSQLETQLLLSEGQLSCYEAGHLARLKCFVDQTGAGFGLLRGIIEKYKTDFRRGRLEGLDQAAFEINLVRYLVEFAHFKAHVDERSWGSGRESNELKAAEFLKRELDALQTPLAKARAAGNAANHYAQAGDYGSAHGLLNAVTAAVGGDADALAWIDASRARVDRHRAERERRHAIRNKQQEIGQMQAQMRRLSRESGRDDSRLLAIERRLQELRVQP